MAASAHGTRQTQADRRERTRSALLEAAARGLSRNAYAGLKLEQVASEAGYTRGALYHLFANKEELALAVVKWVEQTWTAEVGRPAADQAEPVDALLTMARGHALYCRRGVASVMTNLSVEFAGQDHPVGQAISEIFDRLVADCAGWIEAGRENGSIPPGPPPQETALAYLGVLEGLVGQLAGHTPFDVELAERAVRGVLGLSHSPRRSHARSDP